MNFKSNSLLLIVAVVCVVLEAAPRQGHRTSESASKENRAAEGHNRRKDRNKENGNSQTPEPTLVRQKRIKREDPGNPPIISPNNQPVDNSGDSRFKNTKEENQKVRIKNASKSFAGATPPADQPQQPSSAADQQRQQQQQQQQQQKGVRKNSQYHKGNGDGLSKSSGRNRQAGKDKHLAKSTWEHVRGKPRAPGFVHLKQEHDHYDRVMDQALKQANRRKSEHAKAKSFSKKKKHRAGGGGLSETHLQAKQFGLRGGGDNTLKHVGGFGKGKGSRSSTQSGMLSPSAGKQRRQRNYGNDHLTIGNSKKNKMTRLAKDKKPKQYNQDFGRMKRMQRDLARQMSQLQRLKYERDATRLRQRKK